MKAIEFCALAALVSLAGVACRGVAEETANAPADVAVAGNATANAAAEPAGTSAVGGGVADAAAGAVPVADEAPRITADQLAEVFTGSEVFLLDVRRPEELEELGTVEGYTNIPIDELADRLDELPRDQPILTA